MSLRAALCAVAVWLSAAPALATAQTPAPPTLQSLSAQQRALLAQHPVLRFGVEGSWPPIDYYDPQGRYSGVLSSYVAALEQRLGIRFELVHKHSWAETMQAFERGEIDVLPSLGNRAAYGPSAGFTDGFITFSAGIIVRSDEPFVERLSDLPQGKIIAAVQGDSSSDRAIKKNPDLIVVPVHTTEEALFAVSSRRADVAIASLASAYYLTQTLGLSNLKVAANFDEAERSLSMAFRPELVALVPVFNLALTSILPGERQAMRDLWIRVPIDRGVNRSLVQFWLLCGGAALLLLGVWVAFLISQRRRNARFLARAEGAENQIRALIDAVPAVFWTLRPVPEQVGVFDVFGAKDITIAGMPAQSFGRHFEHLGKHMLKEDRHRFATMVQRHSKTMTPFQIEYRLFGPDGQVGWAYVHMLPKIEKGTLLWYGCTFDITARKQLEQALEQSRTQLEEMASSVPGALWQFKREPDGRQYYSYMSEGITGITGRTPAETNQLMQDKSFVSIHPDDLTILQTLMQNLTQRPGTIEEARYRLATTDGGWKWVQVAARAMPVGSDGVMVWNGITLDATHLHEAEAALEQSRALLEERAVATPGALWQFRLEADGTKHFSYLSEGILDITGFTLEKTNALLKDPTFSSVHPDDLAIVQAFIKKLAKRSGIESARYRLATADGGWKWVQGAARASAASHDGALVCNGLTLDATRMHETEEALRQMHLRTEEIANSFPGAIWQMRREHNGAERFTYMSENIRAITGRGPEAALNVPGLPFKVMHEEDRERVIAKLEEGVRTLSATRTDYRLMTASGELRWVTGSSIAHIEADGTTVWNGILMDATEQKQLEMDLLAARENAEAASRAKSQFLANMSHEIRTPMNAVIGLSHIAMTSEVNPVQQARIGKIYTAGKALLKLLNDILEYSRLDAGKFTPMSAPFDLHELKENLRLFNVTSAETKGLAFEINCTPDTPMHWVGDLTRIQQILLNLISNAIKFTDSGRVTLSVTHTEQCAGLRFTVQDTGIGMTPEQLQRVFDVFEQGHGAIERRHGGSGLGLSISRGLAQALGGRIEVESAVGKGTVFTVTLPLQVGSAPITTALPIEFSARLHKLAAEIRERDVMAARTTLQTLHLLLSPLGRDQDLHALERRLTSFDLEGAAVEVAQLQTRWTKS